jgi:zeaxanthin glucosyltransferase
MARLGAFCFPGTGHLNPMTALARALQLRGHEVVIYGIADCEQQVRAAGVEFSTIGQQDYPLGTLRKLDQHLGTLKGLATFKFTVERVRNTARMVLRDGPESVRRSRVEALLVDQADMGGSVAEYLGLPFISIAMFPPLVQDDRIPPFCFGWAAGQGRLSRMRNELGFRLLSRVAAPVFKVANEQRRVWGLPRLNRSTDALSRIAQIAQLPACLEFDVPGRPAILHYTGPFVDHRQRPVVDFPWDKLDGRPLIYASLGTMQNGSEAIFRNIAEACTGLGAQLVISLGGGLDPSQLGALPGDPIVVRYVPQLDIVKKSSAVITHAGMNTVLESLAEGVPLIALPLGNDQPGVAARVAARGAGIVIPQKKLTAQKLRAAVQALLGDSGYRRSAMMLKNAIAAADGLNRAAEIIEHSLGIRSRKPNAWMESVAAD